MTDSNNVHPVAFVSGSTKGIGLAILKELLKEGYFVISNSRKEQEDLSIEFNELLNNSSNLCYMKGDVTQEKVVQSIFNSIISEHKRIDVVVNNVGATQKKPFLRSTVKDFEGCMEENLLTAFNCTKYAIRHMLLQKYGRIINVTSMAGMHGLAFEVEYSSAKAGIVGFTKAIAKEYGGKGITCNAVAPGIIETESKHIDEAHREKLIDTIMVKRFGTPEDVAHLVTYLASHKSSYVTGQVIEINGGLFI